MTKIKRDKKSGRIKREDNDRSGEKKSKGSENRTVNVFTVSQGQRYRATISLSYFESFVGNETIADKLRAAGFTEIEVTGSGTARTATALWPLPDVSGPLPDEITDVSKI